VAPPAHSDKLSVYFICASGYRVCNPVVLCVYLMSRAQLDSVEPRRESNPRHGDKSRSSAPKPLRQGRMSAAPAQ
jgi:hypothetical protein